jgi:hypothetical protein
MKIYFKRIFAALGLMAVPALARAQGMIDDSQVKMGSLTSLAAGGTFKDVSVGYVMSIVIGAFLGLLGIIFLILILLAGYKWMSSQGEENKVAEAKDSIRRALIGLIIILAAYAITYFVFNRLDFASGGSTSAR